MTPVSQLLAPRCRVTIRMPAAILAVLFLAGLFLPTREPVAGSLGRPFSTSPMPPPRPYSAATSTWLRIWSICRRSSVSPRTGLDGGAFLQQRPFSSSPFCETHPEIGTSGEVTALNGPNAKPDLRRRLAGMAATAAGKFGCLTILRRTKPAYARAGARPSNQCVGRAAAVRASNNGTRCIRRRNNSERRIKNRNIPRIFS